MWADTEAKVTATDLMRNVDKLGAKPMRRR